MRAPLRSSFSTLLLIIVFIRVIVDFFHHLLSPLYLLRFTFLCCLLSILFLFHPCLSPPPPKRWRARRDIVGCDLLRLSLLTFVRPSLLYGHVFVLLRFLLLLLFVSFVWGAILLFYYCSRFGACLDGQYWVLSLSGPFSSLFSPFLFFVAFDGSVVFYLFLFVRPAARTTLFKLSLLYNCSKCVILSNKKKEVGEIKKEGRAFSFPSLYG